MASVVNSKLNYITRCFKSHNQKYWLIVCMQIASIAGCRTRSVEIIYRVMFAWCKLLPILHFRLFLVAIVRYSYIDLNRQIPYKLTTVQILKMQNSPQIKSSQHYAKYFVRLWFIASDWGKLQTTYHILWFWDLQHRVI
jgi:hypothetical protein